MEAQTLRQSTQTNVFLSVNSWAAFWVGEWSSSPHEPDSEPSSQQTHKTLCWASQRGEQAFTVEELPEQTKASHPRSTWEASDKERTGRCQQLFQPQRQM